MDYQSLVKKKKYIPVNANIWDVKCELQLDSLWMVLHPGRSLYLPENNLQKKVHDSLREMGPSVHKYTYYPCLKINTLNTALPQLKSYH